MTSMPPPGGDASSDGSWSYRASGRQKRASLKPTSVVPAAPPAASPPTPARNGAGLEPLSKRLLEVAAGLSVLLILVVVVSWLHGSEEASFNPIAQAAARTQRQPGSRIAMQASYSLPGGQSATMSGSGVYDGHNGRTRAVMALDVPSAGRSIQMSLVGDEDTVYIRSSIFDAELPPGYRWIEIQSGLGGSTETSMTSNASSEGQLEMLQSAGGDVENVGEEQVRGTTTTRYRGTVELSRLADRLDGEGKAIAAHEYEQLAKTMPAPIPVEVWVDESGLIRRMRMVMEVPSAAGAPPVKMDLTMDFFDFGIAPKIALPGSGEAFDTTPLGRAQLHLLDGSATGIPTRLDDGPPLSATAFQRRAEAICKAPDPAAARLKKGSERLGRRVKEVVALVKAGSASPQAMVRVLDRYAETYLEPVISLGVHALDRLARLSPPPAQRAAVQRFVHLGAIALEADTAFARAFELGSLDRAKELAAEVRTYAGRAKAAAIAAHLHACATESGASA